MTSATYASHVPRPDPSVARNSRRKPARRRSRSSWRRRDEPTWRTKGNSPPANRTDGLFRAISSARGRDSIPQTSERRREEGVLVGGSDRDADRRGGAEGAQRADDHAEAQQLVEEEARIGPGVGVEEVGDGGRGGLEAVVAKRPLELGAAGRVHLPA